MQHFFPVTTLGVLSVFISFGFAGEPNLWNQWRGPNRDGFHLGNSFPNNLAKESLQLSWKANLGPSYSGPIVSDQLVFTTETKIKNLKLFMPTTEKQEKKFGPPNGKAQCLSPFLQARMAVGLELPLHLMANACMLQESKMFLFA